MNWIVVSVIVGCVLFVAGFGAVTWRALSDFEKQWNDGQWRR
jgi:hypothetical protein